VRIDGKKFVDKDNNSVRRGFSIADPYYLNHYDYHFSEEIIADLEHQRREVLIRLGWWQGRPKKIMPGSISTLWSAGTRNTGFI